jgi:hypothetical protein
MPTVDIQSFIELVSKDVQMELVTRLMGSRPTTPLQGMDIGAPDGDRSETFEFRPFGYPGSGAPEHVWCRCTSPYEEMLRPWQTKPPGDDLPGELADFEII